MSDAFLVPLRHSEHSRDFHKPVTVQALARFDRDLNLIFNRRTGSFEIHRKTRRWRRLWMAEHETYLSFPEDMLIYVCDWDEGLMGSDDPTALLAALEAGDTVRHPELFDDDRVLRTILEQREAPAAIARENFRHAFESNRRQLLPAWEKVRNSPTLVR